MTGRNFRLDVLMSEIQAMRFGNQLMKSLSLMISTYSVFYSGVDSWDFHWMCR